MSSCWRPWLSGGSLSRYRDAGPDLDAARAAGDLWPEAGGHPRRAPALAAAAARDASAAAGAAVWRRRGHSGRAKEKGPAVGLALAQILGLSLPDTPWHSQRDRLLEAGAWFAGVCGTLGKFANDFSLLMQTEVAEIGEPVAEGRGGSSTMPHKRNPVACAAILTAAQRTPGLMATLYASQLQQHERALGGWQAEWETLPELITLVGGALAQSEALVRDMQVFPQKMRADLDITHGLIMAEAVTLALAEFIGKAEAHHHIEALCRQALDRHYPLVDLLAADPQVSQYLSRERLTTLLDPATATGSAERFVRQVLARYQEQRDES